MCNTSVDIQKITAEIKAEVAAKGPENYIPAFDELTLRKVESSNIDLNLIRYELDYLKQHEIRYYREVTSYHKRFTFVVTFVKRVIRKLCKFLGEPVIDEINEYHRHIVKVFEHTERILGQTKAYAEAQSAYETQLMNVHKYKLLAEQYAAVNYHMGKDLKTLQVQLQELQQNYEQLKLQSERAELKADIAKLRTEGDKQGSGE